MKFRDKKTGKVFENIETALNVFCNDRICEVCYFGLLNDCEKFSRENPNVVAPIMGYEVIEDEGCDPNWSEAGKQFYKSLLNPGENIEDKPTETHDNVDHPAHYNQGGVECIDALKAATVGLEGIQAFCTANAIKYLWRWKSKGGAEDLDKAIWYIQRLKEEIRNG